MKIRRLPDTDLAEISALPIDRRRPALEGFEISFSPHSYYPSLCSLSDTMNWQPPMFPQPMAPWDGIRQKIVRLANHKKPTELPSNLGVSRAMYDFVASRGLVGRELKITDMPMGGAFPVTFWAPGGLVIDGRLVIPFLNFRRTGLSPAGRRIVLSIMREHIDTRHQEYADARLAVFHFSGTTHRTIKAYYADEIELMGFDELQERIQTTYEIWYDVMEKFAARTRKSEGGSGSLV